MGFNEDYVTKQQDKAKMLLAEAQGILAGAYATASEKETALQKATNAISMAATACMNAANMQSRIIVEGKVL